ncbi:MAG: 2-C-methyl-D-erythritol 4-phosphate cytidylyltransferase [Bacilli bacterium]|nr:2-C-methyl-D-erythritol 4-phosphate cytidylyltransferase [Bacilli bacterium]
MNNMDTHSSPKKIAILLLGGVGKRLDSETPKQFIKISGKPLFFFALDVLENSNQIDEILIVSAKEHIETVKDLTGCKTKIINVIEGGKTRAESVHNAIKYLLKNNYGPNSMVIICDGARPNLKERYIEETIDNAKSTGAAIVAINAIDSIAVSKGETIDSYLPRESILIIQTPQTFKLDILEKAYESAKEIDSYTDEGSLVMKTLNVHPYIVKGDKTNIKITVLEDLEMFERSLK